MEKKITLDDGMTVLDLAGCARMLQSQAEELPLIGDTNLFGEEITHRDLHKAMRHLALMATHYVKPR